MGEIHPLLAVIGGGNMAGAILRGAAAAGVVDVGRVVVAEPDEAKRAGLAKLGVAVCPGAAEALRWVREREEAGGAGQVMLAVKPQSLGAVGAELGPVFGAARRVVVSILAGTPSDRVRGVLGEAAAVVRVMPNTPAQVGKGVSGVSLGAGAVEGDEAFAVALFGGVGDVVRIDEGLMDAFTAVAGSGPAYVFYLAEAMVRGAEAVGFDREIALRVVKGTVAGAGALLDASGEEPGALRAAVTSKGGTTAAALGVFETAGVGESIVRAIAAARDRGRELGRM